MNKKASLTFWVILVIIAIVVIVWVVAYPTAPSGTTASNQNSAMPADLNASAVTSTVHVLYGDAFTLTNGQASITGHSFSATSTPLIPVGYSLAATGFGDISGTGINNGAVSILYRNFGADIQQLAIFGFKDVNGTLEQIASGVIYTGDTQVQSISIVQGIITVSMLVVSPADMANLPHSAQKPTESVIMKLQINGSNFVEAQ